MNHRLLIVIATVAATFWAAVTMAFMAEDGVPFATAGPAAAALVAAGAVLSAVLIAALNWASRGDR